MSKGSTVVIALLLIVIVLLAWLLVVNKAEAPTIPTATTTAGTTSDTGTTGTNTEAPKPLHDSIVVTFPKTNANVPKKFTVTGKAPGNWFFEAQAPAIVQAPDGTKIAQGQMLAQGNWQTNEPVAFTADISVDQAYSGPATLVLLKDNESGLPQNDDSLEIPIVIQ